MIASPWSRGGYVCSQVFVRTSVLQLAERVLSHRTGKDIRESNISQWRRQVCGDLSSAFRSPRQDAMKPVVFPDRAHFLENIHKAQFKPMIGGFTRSSSRNRSAARGLHFRCRTIFTPTLSWAPIRNSSKSCSSRGNPAVHFMPTHQGPIKNRPSSGRAPCRSCCRREVAGRLEHGRI